LKDQPIAKTLPTWENNDGGSSNDEDYDKTHTHTLQVGFQSTVPVLELQKIIHTSDHMFAVFTI
jgi:hypothetical protein